MLSPEQQHEMLVLLHHAKKACWNKQGYSSIALTIDKFYETIEGNEVCKGLEWEYIEPRTKPDVVDDIFAD